MASAFAGLPFASRRAPLASARASPSFRTPNSKVSGGRPARGLVTAAARVRVSPRLCSQVIATVAATTTAAAAATVASTRVRAVIAASVSSPCTAIFKKVMPSYRELLQQVKAEIGEVDAARAHELLDSAERPLLVDVREQDEWSEGHLPGAIHVSRGNLESRIERAAPDRARPIVLYCQSGARPAFAAKTLEELGYENVVSLSGGFTDWKRNGFPTELPRVLDGEKRSRYSRHLLIPEVGEEGQLKLLDSRVLLIGAGGLGSPASLYLAAAGVGRLGIVDDDRVHASIYRFEGQVTVFKPHEGPCYRCLFPQPPPPELAPSCAEGGVLGVLPGIIGSLQANETLKLALGIGDTLTGRLLLFDALSTEFSEVTLRRDPACPVCGESPTITEYVDYVEFCQGRPQPV